MIKKTLLIAVVCCFTVAVHAQSIPKLKMDDVVKLFENKSDTTYVINFWATFCKPCVAEIPNFIKIADKYKAQKVKLLLVSVDLPSFYPKRVAAFAISNKFTTNLAWLDETDADHFCPMIDKNWSGAIPATIMVNAKTGYKKFFEGEIKGEEFEKQLKGAIDNSKITLGASEEDYHNKYQSVLLHIRSDSKINEQIKMAFPKLTSKKEKYVEFNVFGRVDFLSLNPFKNDLLEKEYFTRKELLGTDSASYFKNFFFESFESDFLKKIAMPNNSKLYLTFSRPFDSFLIAEIGDLRSKTSNYRFGSGLRIFFKFNESGMIEDILYVGINYG